MPAERERLSARPGAREPRRAQLVRRAAFVGPTLAVVGGTGTRAPARRAARRQASCAVARLSRPRASAQAFELGGKLYVLGGEQAGKPADDILRIDLGTGHGKHRREVRRAARRGGGRDEREDDLPGRRLDGREVRDRGAEVHAARDDHAPFARLPEGLRVPAVAAPPRPHTLYVAGGRTASGPSARVYAVDLTSGVVTPLAELPSPVQGAVLVPSGTGLYLLGGTGPGGKPSRAVVRIDPATGKPTPAGRLPKALVGAAAVPAGSQTLVVDPSAGAIYRIE